MTIGEKIRNRRLELGLSAAELAKRIGKNRTTIYRYESEEIMNLPVSVLIPIAKALDVTPASLMGWDEKEPSEENSTEKMLYNIMKDMSDDELTQLLLYARYLKSQHNQ